MKHILVSAGLFMVTALISVQGQTNYEAYYFGTLAGYAGFGSSDGVGTAAEFRTPAGAAVDSAGNVYVADANNDTIRRITSDGVVTTLAGVPRAAGSTDGTGSAARFNGPYHLALDSAGNVYVSDKLNHTVRKITPAGVVTTVAGLAGSAGSADGSASVARFNRPSGVALDSSGNIYVTDQSNHTIRKITTDGVVSTIAGLAGSPGSADGNGAAAQFNTPAGVALDSGGNLYVADEVNSTIRKITPAGAVTTLAGLAGSGGFADGSGSAARFNYPAGVAVDSVGNVFVADLFNTSIRKISPAGVVTTLAGGGGNAQLNVLDVAINGTGTVYAPSSDEVVYKITSAGAVSILAGAGPNTSSAGTADGARNAARFHNPQGIALDAGGNIYVADNKSHTIRKVTARGVVSTLAGAANTPGSSDGVGTAAQFSGPVDLTVDAGGNVYVADEYNSTIRRITPGGVVTTFAGAAGNFGSADGSGAAAQFYYPLAIALDTNGNLYVSDNGNQTIRKITPAGVVTTLAGLAGNAGNTDGVGSNARFYLPGGLVADSVGNVYVADSGNSTIRKITPGGTVTTVAGLAGSTGTADGTGSLARFYAPEGITTDSSGNLYVTDQGNHTIRKITPAGVVTTLGGLPDRYTTDCTDGTGSTARFTGTKGIAVGNGGRFYIVDGPCNTIRTGLIANAATSTHQHGNTAALQLNLSLIAAPTVEPRSGGAGQNHTLSIGFARTIGSGTFAISSGAATIVGSNAIAGDSATLNLTGVADAQTVTVTASNLVDTAGRSIPDTTFSVSFLLGDANGDGVVNSADATQTRNHSGQSVDWTNFLIDANTDGSINSADATIVRIRSGQFIPGAPTGRAVLQMKQSEDSPQRP